MRIVTNSEGWCFSDKEKIRLQDVERGGDILGAVPERGMIKTASTGGQDLIKAVADALVGMGIKANIDIGEFLKRIAGGALEKTAEDKSGESSEVTVKIASKRVEDSHFFIDVSRDIVKKAGKSLILISAYMREGYLGRYMMKRNYYYLPDNPQEADEVYEELIAKAKKIKRRYHDEKIGINDIFPEFRSILDATRGDLEFENEDRAGTTVYRDRNSGHVSAGPSYIRNA